jgi:hypothetical protein
MKLSRAYIHRGLRAFAAHDGVILSLFIAGLSYHQLPSFKKYSKKEYACSLDSSLGECSGLLVIATRFL